LGRENLTARDHAPVNEPGGRVSGASYAHGRYGYNSVALEFSVTDERQQAHIDFHLRRLEYRRGRKRTPSVSSPNDTL
jgi:hypothetical protein